MSEYTETQPTLLVTGCSGLIGTRLIDELANDYRIVGLDVKPMQRSYPSVSFVECDLTDDDSVAAALASVQNKYGSRLASIVHLAAYYDFSGEPSPLYEELTIEGTRRLLEELKRSQFCVEQFIFASTLLVMQSAEEGEDLTEASPVDAEWGYPESKLKTERLIREEHGSIPAVILRVAGVYDEDGNSVPIAQQISRIYEKQLESYLFPGEKEHGQAFVHLDDLVDCFRQAIERRKQLDDCESFLIGEEDVMSYDELQDSLGLLLHGEEWTTIRIPKAVAKVGAWVKDKLAGSEDEKPFIKPWMVDLADQNYPISIRRARERLEWTPKHTLRDTLGEMIARLKRDPRGWYERHGLPQPEGLPTA